MLQQYQLADGLAPVPYAFSIQDKVAQGDFTKWRIVYDISDRKIYFHTDQYKAERSFSLDELYFSLYRGRWLLIFRGKPGKLKSIPLSFDQNRALIRKSVVETGNRINTSPRRWLLLPTILRFRFANDQSAQVVELQ